MSQTHTPTLSKHAPNGYGELLAEFVENEIAQGRRVTMKTISAHMGVPPMKLRPVLIKHYGSKITFTRGRTGGIAITN